MPGSLEGEGAQQRQVLVRELEQADVRHDGNRCSKTGSRSATTIATSEPAGDSREGVPERSSSPTGLPTGSGSREWPRGCPAPTNAAHGQQHAACADLAEPVDPGERADERRRARTETTGPSARRRRPRWTRAKRSAGPMPATRLGHDRPGGEGDARSTSPPPTRPRSAGERACARAKAPRVSEGEEDPRGEDGAEDDRGRGARACAGVSPRVQPERDRPRESAGSGLRRP